MDAETRKKLTEGMDPDQEKLFKELLVKEIKNKMLKKIDDKDPDFYKTLKFFLDSDTDKKP